MAHKPGKQYQAAQKQVQAKVEGGRLTGAKIPVTFNVANLNANASLGALLLHHHNKAGSTAETLTVPPAHCGPWR